MIYCVNHNSWSDHGDLLASQFRLRYSSIIDRQYWDLPHYRGMEYDQYDTPAATYLVWADEKGEARGVSRLTPTDRPYMLQEVWPDMVETIGLPVTPSVWEGTRFCVDKRLPPELRKHVTKEIVCAYLEFSLANDIRHIIGVMPPGIWRSVFMRNGWDVSFLGDKKKSNDGTIVAGMMDVTLMNLAKVREKTGIKEPVLTVERDEVEVFRKAA